MSTHSTCPMAASNGHPVASPGTGKAAPDPTGVPGAWTLVGLFRAYRWRILLTYMLFNLENLLRLAQPLVLGLAIDSLLRRSYGGLALFVGQHLAHLVVGSLRRLYDTRAFTGIYADLAAGLVFEQRRDQVDVSRVAARSALSRAFVDFFERDVPVVVQSLYSVAGSLVLLCLYDCVLVSFCLALVVPACLLNTLYGSRTLFFSVRLHDELEREVAVIGRNEPEDVRAHYRRVGRWHIKLSDWEALNFGLIEVFVLGLLAASLIRCCSQAPGPGDILAVFRYVLMFVMGLDSVPRLVQQLSRLRDIGNRLRSAASDRR